MKERKNFFNDKNKLNKGYSKNIDQVDSYYDVLNESLPKPEILAEYEALYPGSSERFLKIIEDEQRHRHNLDEKSLALEMQYKKFGQVSLVLIIAILSYASYAILLNEAVILSGIIFIITSFSTLITIVIRSSSKNHHKKL